MTDRKDCPALVNDAELEAVQGGVTSLIKAEVKGESNDFKLTDSYDLTATMNRGLRSDGDLVQAVSDKS